MTIPSSGFRRFRFLAVLACLAPLSAMAQSGDVYCQYTYGGETKTLHVVPSQTPLTVPAKAVGSWFLFRALLDEVPDAAPGLLAALKTYVYVARDSGPVLIHQGLFPWPVTETPVQPFGFTGLHRVYEPESDGEFEYWCSTQAAGEVVR
ncbi:MAG: hypothetical protein WC023_04850 [Rhodocyclaceae bacterium]